jgi:hypothetical protein
MKRAGQEPNISTSARAEPRKSKRFLVGKNSADQWVARDEYGRCGGIFTNQPDALHFARREVGDAPCTIVLVAEPLELFVRLAAARSSPISPALIRGCGNEERMSVS